MRLPVNNAGTQPLFFSLNLLSGDVAVPVVVVVCLNFRELKQRRRRRRGRRQEKMNLYFAKEICDFLDLFGSLMVMMVQTKCKLNNTELFLRLFHIQCKEIGNNEFYEETTELEKWQSEISSEY